MKRLMGKFLLISASLFLMAPSLEAAQKLKMSTIAPGSSAYLVMTTMATSSTRVKITSKSRLMLPEQQRSI